jgi:L-ascorbate metabolism protein UlaG (beta-lactamase superfamily)
VIGFLVEAPGQPTIWVSGDTVLHAPLREALGGLRAQGKRVDVAIIHCGAVNFPKLPVLGKQLFTFDAAQAIAAVGLPHFRQPEAELRAAFNAAGLGARTRFLDVGETLTL